MNVSDAIVRAQAILIDSSADRYTYKELAMWVNECFTRIAKDAPKALEKIEALSLSEGVKQELPDYRIKFTDVYRNVELDDDGEISRRLSQVTFADRFELDMSEPDWMDEDYTRSSTLVTHIVRDPAYKSFWVYPPNDGTGCIEAGLVVIPEPLDTTSTLTASSFDIELDYADKAIVSAMADYIIFRALSKEDSSNAEVSKASQHLQLFVQQLGNLGEPMERPENPKPNGSETEG